MRSFLKYLLATIVGIFIVNTFFFLLGFVFLIAIVLSTEQTPEISQNSILKIGLNYKIVDRAFADPFENLGFLFESEPSMGLNQILSSIEYASNDKKIKGIYLDLSYINSNFGAKATLEEIRHALLEFKKSGKFIYSYSNLGYSQGAYYLASVADRVFVNPESPLMLSGLANGVAFYKDMMDKMGVKAQVFKVGTYKSAVEPYMSMEMSEASRTQMMVYLESQWRTMVAGIARSRSITEKCLNDMADSVGQYTTQDELQMGLYDSLLYEDGMLGFLRNTMDLKPKQSLNMVELRDYQQTMSMDYDSDDKEIAVIYAQGEIVDEQSATTIGLDLCNTIRDIREDKSVKAVVLRVNSPGGSAAVSDVIWQEVYLMAQTKPTIVSMGNVAASGGYYIACAASTIVADTMTLTGSIGIFGLALSGEDLFNDKLGLQVEMVGTNAHSDFGGGSILGIHAREMNGYERNVMQKMIDRGYETFLKRVSLGRNMTYAEVDKVAQGRVWTGEDALKVGLVDTLGGLELAISIAAEKANLTNYKIGTYPREGSAFEEFMKGLGSASIKERIIRSEMGEAYRPYALLKQVSQVKSGMMARMPYEIIDSK